MLIVVVGLHVDFESRLLVQRRPLGAAFPGLWEFPGGKVDDGETMRQALVREWREELGLDVSVGELVDEVVLDFPELNLKGVLLPLFVVHYDGRNERPRPRLGQEIRRLPWDQVKDLPGTPTMPRYAAAVEKYLWK